MKCLLNLDVDMNLMALTSCGKFDGRAFVRKLSFKDIFLLICCGKHITSLDRISVYITFGKFLRNTRKVHGLDLRLAGFCGNICMTNYLKGRVGSL